MYVIICAVISVGMCVEMRALDKARGSREAAPRSAQLLRMVPPKGGSLRTVQYNRLGKVVNQ